MIFADNKIPISRGVNLNIPIIKQNSSSRMHPFQLYSIVLEEQMYNSTEKNGMKEFKKESTARYCSTGKH